MTTLNYQPMPAVNQAPKGTLWTGRIISLIPILMLLFSAVLKFVKPPSIVQEFTRLGYAEHHAVVLGILELGCTIIYAIPATSILGAILLTGYLGGAMASHVRIGSPLFTHTLFGLYLGLMVWGGLWLRDRNLRSLIPFRR